MIKRGIFLSFIILNIVLISLNTQAQLFFSGVTLAPKVVTLNEKINLTITADKSFKFYDTASICGVTGKKEIPLNGLRFSRAVIQNNTCIRNCQTERWFEGNVNATFSFPPDTQDGTFSVNVYGCRVVTGKWNCTWFSGIVQYASDIIPPVILTLTPDNNVVVTNGKNLQLSMTFNDQGAGIDSTKVSFILKGKNTVQEESIKATTVTSISATAKVKEELLKGHYSVTGIILDKSGNRATKTNIFDVGLAHETPLIIKDLLPEGGASSSSDRSKWLIKILVEGLQEIELGKLTNNVFTDSNTGEGPLLIDSNTNSDSWTAQQIIVKSERGTHNIFIPTGSNIGCGQGVLSNIKYYVAADGTTYHAHQLNNGCGNLLDVVDAMKPSHLARRAP